MIRKVFRWLTFPVRALNRMLKQAVVDAAHEYVMVRQKRLVCPHEQCSGLSLPTCPRFSDAACLDRIEADSLAREVGVNVNRARLKGECHHTWNYQCKTSKI